MLFVHHFGTFFYLSSCFENSIYFLHDIDNKQMFSLRMQTRPMEYDSVPSKFQPEDA